MEEELKKLIGNLAFQIAKQSAEIRVAAEQIAALKKENEELKKSKGES